MAMTKDVLFTNTHNDDSGRGRGIAGQARNDERGTIKIRLIRV